MKQIIKDIKHLFETNNFNFNDKEVQPMLNEVLEDHHVLLNETCTDWKNAIKKFLNHFRRWHYHITISRCDDSISRRIWSVYRNR